MSRLNFDIWKPGLNTHQAPSYSITLPRSTLRGRFCWRSIARSWAASSGEGGSGASSAAPLCGPPDCRHDIAPVPTREAAALLFAVIFATYSAYTQLLLFRYKCVPEIGSGAGGKGEGWARIQAPGCARAAKCLTNTRASGGAQVKYRYYRARNI
jgi:hypothetical protein